MLLCRLHGYGVAALCVGALMAPAAWAQGKSAEADALALEADAPADAGQAGGAGTVGLLAEAELSHRTQRYGLSAQTGQRLSLDYRGSQMLGQGVRGQLSARVDQLEPADARLGRTVLSLRELFISSQIATNWGVDAGRIALRDGSGYGYNPTDFFRANTIRTAVTSNPVALRESRLGTVGLRAQWLGAGQSASIFYAPRLGSSARSSSGVSADLGATNLDDQVQLRYAFQLGKAVSLQALVHKRAGAHPSIGFGGTALAGDQLVLHGEWSVSSEETLVSTAGGQSAPRHRGQRAVLGGSYTLGTQGTVTLEWQHNSLAPNRSQWLQLRALGLSAASSYYLHAFSQQDSASRDALLVYVQQPQLFGMQRVTATVLGKFNRSDRSRLVWASLRYRFDRMDVALQMQSGSGVPASEFGTDPVQRVLGVVASTRF